jgi:hypothetical protein
MCCYKNRAFCHPDFLGAAHVLSCFGMQADMVYMDRDHEYLGVKTDLAAYYPMVKKGGVFFGDDAQIPGVLRAVQEMVQRQGGKLQVVDSRTWYIWKDS